MLIFYKKALANYISQCVSQLEKNNWKSIEVKSATVNTFHKATQERLKNMIWETVEDSWYKSANGNLPNNYPGRTMEYRRVTKKVDFDAYHVVA